MLDRLPPERLSSPPPPRLVGLNGGFGCAWDIPCAASI